MEEKKLTGYPSIDKPWLKYYSEEATLQKQNNDKPITDTRLAIWLRDRLYPLLIFLTGTKVRYKIEVENACNPIPGKPIIFAANHSAFQDTPIMLRVTKQRSYIFAGKQNLAFIDWVFFILNGTIWVDRKSKEDMAASKDAVLAYLAKGQSILWFPEGTWNLTPSQLMMPMKWGIIDMARTAGAQIVPTALDYDREKNTCRVKFGAPMVGEVLENKAEAIRDLRDTMATLRWDLMGSQPVLHRADITPEQLQKEMYRVIDEYPPLDWAYENSCIYHPHTEPEETFAHLDMLIPCWENAFLLRER